MATTNRSETYRGMLMVAAAALMLAPASGQAQQDTGKSSTMRDAKDIATQPVRDVGIEKTKIPPLLIEASDDPYAMRGAGTCRQIASSIGALNGVLGPDFGSSGPRRKTSVVKAGGEAVVGSLIPFRGVVREISGAAPAERRLQAAITAGFARRGFLRGLQRARKC
ncbi:hypothetical protein GCM10009087_42060 [Sphingomonas oligophenolica]|uniref:Uncharacterized protein n=1 Tax=Sphingomonas oligophenolica TaxID=301154 RepID=A0ABU9YCH2_9SPHN